MLLIYPPVAKCGEPPVGIARLSAVLKAHGHRVRIWDANLEGLRSLYLKGDPKAAYFEEVLRTPLTYTNLDRHTHGVKRLNRALARTAENFRITLGNYISEEYSPYSVEDLNRAAQEYRNNPFTPFFRERLRHETEHHGITRAGISLQYLSQALCSFALAGLIREEFPHLKILFGGGLVTTWSRLPHWENPFSEWFDHFIPGAGEEPLLNILGTPPLKEFLESPPDYTEIKDLPYLSPGFVLPYSASLGCSWKRCRFCPEKAENNPYIPVPVTRAVSHLGDLNKEYRPSLIHLVDNEVSPALQHKMIQTPPGAPWYGFCRFTDDLLSPSYCMELARSGCTMLKLGLESGSQKVLDHMDKGIVLEKVSVILKNLVEAGIRPYVYIMFGSPWENAEDAEETVLFLERNAAYLGGLNVSIFNMPRSGTEDGDISVGNIREDLSLYHDFVHPEGWSRYKIRRFLTGRVFRNSLINPVIKSVPVLFNANHAPFFRMP